MIMFLPFFFSVLSFPFRVSPLVVSVFFLES